MKDILKNPMLLASELVAVAALGACASLSGGERPMQPSVEFR